MQSSSTRAGKLRVCLLGSLTLLLPLAVVAPRVSAAHARTAPSASEQLTPPMGVDPWYSHQDTHGAVDEAAIRETANFLARSGMQGLGYREVALGNWWKDGLRNADGSIAVDPVQWPHGVRAVANELHAKGFTTRAYTDIGPHGCINEPSNSYDHYQQDADVVAGWGLDALTVDWCGAYLGDWSADRIRAAYTSLAGALHHNSAHRPVTLDIALYDPRQESDNSEWMSQVAETYRIGQDIGALGVIQFSRVLASIDKMAVHPETTGPGHYRDPDMVLAGVGPITDDEGRLQMSMWSMLSAPLILGTDVLHMSPATRATVTNPEIIAIDQDPLVKMATKIGEYGPGGDIWVKQLSAHGERAVALMNRTDHSATISTSARAVGLGHADMYALRDVWRHSTTATRGRIAATVPAHGVVVYRVAPIDHAQLVPAVSIAVSTPGRVSAATGAAIAEVGRTTTVSVDVENNGSEPIRLLDTRLDLPTDWVARALPTAHRAVASSRHVTLSWRVTPAVNARVGAYPFSVTAHFRAGSARVDTVSTRASIGLVSVPTGSPYLSDLADLTTTASGWESVTNDPTPPVEVNGVTYLNSVTTPVPASADYFLGGRCSRFTSVVALDDHDAFGQPHHGRAVLQVLRDGVVVAQRTLESGAAQTTHVDVDIRGARSLRINAIDTGGYWNYAYASVQWAGAHLTCAGKAP